MTTGVISGVMWYPCVVVEETWRTSKRILKLCSSVDLGICTMYRNISTFLTSLRTNRMPILSGCWLAGYFVTQISKRSFSTGFQNASTSSSTPCSSLPSFSHKTKMDNISSSYSLISKPPNILIYTGKEDKERKFEAIKAQLHEVLNRDSYTVYPLDDYKVLGHPWAKNSVLLVIYNNERTDDKILDEFKMYIKDGGNVLCVGRGCEGLVSGIELENLQLDSTKTFIVDAENPDIQQQQKAMHIDCQPFSFAVSNNEIEVIMHEMTSGHPVMIFQEDQKSQIILSAVDIFHQSCSEAKSFLLAVLKKLEMKCTSNDAPDLTPAYLLASEKDKIELIENLKPHLTKGLCKGQKLSLFICNDLPTLSTVKVTEDKLPVIVDHNRDMVPLRFDWEVYLKHLKTQRMGRILLYTDVTHSTQTILEGNPTLIKSIPKHCGVVAVTNRQLKGKGRGGNAWLSPIGCMMFSIVIPVRFNSELGSRLPYIQHIASLAFILAVKCMPGYQDINICLKWPNDIYYDEQIKIGGVVVSSTALGNELNAVIGMGVNISNKEPTICINEIIKEYNNQNGTMLAPLQLEVLLARTITYMEELIDGFQINGKESFLEKYYKHWMHGGCKVTLKTGLSPHQVTIVGLDDFGFLMVKRDNGEKISLQPDGNTFDILANLIEIKT